METLSPSAPSASPAPRGRPGLAYLAFLLLFLALYAATTQRGPAWQDSGTFQYRILQGDPVGNLGLALSHPLLIVLGRLAACLPLGPVPWRINLVSALAGAFAAANVGLLIRRLAPHRPAAAWLGAGIFAFAHTTWWLATICESQTLHAALFTGALLAAVSLLQNPRHRTVGLLGLLGGLALTAHNLALLAAPAYLALVVGLCWKKRLSPWALLWLTAGYLVGASAFLALILMDAANGGLIPALRSALFGHSWQNAVLLGSLKSARTGAGYLLYNLPNLALPLAAAALVHMRRRLSTPFLCLWAYLLAIYLWFAVRYDVADAFMFFLPFYALVAVAAGLGAAWLAGPARRWLAVLAWLSLLWTPACYAAAPYACRAWNVNLPGRKDLPRDATAYWLVPWKGHEESAERFARQALRQVPPGGTLLADGTARYALLLTQRLDGLGVGVAIPDLADLPPDTLIGKSGVFAISPLRGYCPRWVLDNATLRARGVLYEVTWRPRSP